MSALHDVWRCPQCGMSMQLCPSHGDYQLICPQQDVEGLHAKFRYLTSDRTRWEFEEIT